MQHNYSILYSNIIRDIDKVIYGSTKTRNGDINQNFTTRLNSENCSRTTLEGLQPRMEHGDMQESL